MMNYTADLTSFGDTLLMAMTSRGATAVMKVRTENDIELVAADCVIDGDSVTVKIPGERSREIPRRYRVGKYDVFVTKDGEYSYKLIMGDMRIIQDESMH